MNIRHRKWLAVSLPAVLIAAVAGSTPALALAHGDEGFLASNEAAARNAIVDSTFAYSSVRVDSSPATLARNERAAQRVVVDTEGGSSGTPTYATDDVTLARNELAAQHVIVDAPAPSAAVKAVNAHAGLDTSNGATAPVAAR